MIRREGAPLLFFLLACTGSEAESGKDSVESIPGWEAIGTGLPSALMCINGTSSSDVWAVGADVGSGPAILHYDGDAWEQITGASSGDLWWVAPIGTGVYMVGAGGRVLRYDPATKTLSETVTDPALTLFGIWGASEDAMWTVGGNLSDDTAGGALYHWEGRGWTSLALPTTDPVRALYKVWGSSPDDVWIVGSDGAILHKDATDLTQLPAPVERNLFTVHGAEGVAYAVGGFSTATIARNDGSGWVDDTPMMAPQLNGVFVRSATEATAVGNQGAIWNRDASGWTEDSRHDTVFYDFHATWADEGGGLWAVGGHLSGDPLNEGILYYFGTSAPATL